MVRHCASDSSAAQSYSSLVVAYSFCKHLLAFNLQPKPINAVTIAVSSRTLFNMVTERKVFEEEGLERYVAHQLELEDQPFTPGVSFPFVKVTTGLSSTK